MHDHQVQVMLGEAAPQWSRSTIAQVPKSTISVRILRVYRICILKSKLADTL